MDPGNLGVVYTHEHVVITTPELQGAFPGFMGFDREDALRRAQAELAALKSSGVDTIVDMTVPGLGRDVRLVDEAQEGTGLTIIAATGYYTYDRLPLPFAYNGHGRQFHHDERDSFLVDLFVSDIRDGIQGTSIRAGVLKCCADVEGITADVERVTRAVARAHLETGIPILTHADALTRRGREQQDILHSEGVDLTRVVIGHSSDTTDLDYLMQVMDRGSVIGFDRCGLQENLPVADQITTLVALCLRGYADRIVLSHDRHVVSDWHPEAELIEQEPEWRFGFIKHRLLPAIRERGVDEEMIRAMLIDNPARVLTPAPGVRAPQ